MAVASMSGAPGLAIRTEDLRKTYKSSRGDVPAVRGIDLDVRSGQFFGLLLGTIMDPRKMQMLFAVILLPATMLGCVYYPWSALHSIRWLQILVLINPMVYMSEGLRAVLTPSLGHMPMWGVLAALIGGTVVFGYLGTRTFTKRVLN